MDEPNLGWMGIISRIYIIAPIIQVITAVHVIKTGRAWSWLWIILCFPLVGSVVYVIVEILPDFQRFTFRGMVDSFLNAFEPGRKHRLLREAMEETDTVQNRKALADYYASIQEQEKAADLYRSCLAGVFKDDPEISLCLCSALLESGKNEEAEKILDGLRKKNVSHGAAKRDLLYARVVESSGKEDKALGLYGELVQNHASEVEAWWRYGRLLEKAGRKNEANELYEKILKRAKSFSRHHRRAQRVWLKSVKASWKAIA